MKLYSKKKIREVNKSHWDEVNNLNDKIRELENEVRLLKYIENQYSDGSIKTKLHKVAYNRKKEKCYIFYKEIKNHSIDVWLYNTVTKQGRMLNENFISSIIVEDYDPNISECSLYCSLKYDYEIEQPYYVKLCDIITTSSYTGHRIGEGSLLLQSFVEICRDKKINFIIGLLDGEVDGLGQFYIKNGFEIKGSSIYKDLRKSD